MHFIPPSPGMIFCNAANKIDQTKAKAHVFVRDIDEDMSIYGINDTEIIALGDEITITCAAATYFFTNDIQWFDKNHEPIQESDSKFNWRRMVLTNLVDSHICIFHCSNCRY